jgi:murein peptide amidase A
MLMKQAPRRCRPIHLRTKAPWCCLLSLCALLPACSAIKPSAHIAESPPAPAWQVIGHSFEGRSIEALTLGHGPVRVYLIGGIHGNEPEGLAAIEVIAADILANSSSASASTVRIVQDLNPDGTALATRGNARGIDLNRNWPTTNFVPRRQNGPAPLSEPETAAIHADLQDFAPHLVLVFHSIAAGPFVNFDGPGAEFAREFADAATLAAHEAGDPPWRIEPNMGYATPGSLGTFIGVERQIPILTIEFRRGQAADAVVRAAVAGVRGVLIAAVEADRAQN